MPEEPSTPPPKSPAPGRLGQNVGAAFSGETTGSVPNLPTGEETVLMGSDLRSSVEVIGDFEILGKLGQGGMGAVYRARQRSLDRQVALKILPSTLEADADFVSRFQREARVAANLNHANLVKVYASGAADGTHFIAMELVEGETLGQWLKRGALPPPEALRICADVARALEHGWNRAQLIHRDIKPGNIFLSIHGDVKVGDLGLAKSMSGDTTGLTQTGTAMGTPHYISPEQARGESDLDFRADIYSLGCTLYQMLTGRTPYTGSDPLVVMGLHRDAPPPAILKVLPSCPIPLARLVGKMLKKNKRERQASYAELIAEIERARAVFVPATSVLEATLPPDPDATQLATPGHTPRSATPVTAPLARTTGPAPAAKSKAPLYGGLAAGVVVLGIVAFLVWPKEEKLTKAELYAKQREAEQAAATPATDESVQPLAATSPNSSTPPTSEPAAITLWDTPEKRPKDPKYIWENGILRVPKKTHLEGPRVGRDVIMRASIRYPSDQEAVAIKVRAASSVGGSYLLALKPDNRSVVLFVEEEANWRVIRRWNLSRAYEPGEWLRLQLRAEGDTLTASLDGQILGTTHHTSITEAGKVGLFAGGEGHFRDIEYIPLDGVAASAPPAAEPWQDALRDPTRLALTGGAKLTPQGLSLSNLDTVSLRLSSGWPSNGAVRARSSFGGANVKVMARAQKDGHYQFYVTAENKTAILARWEALGRHVPLGEFSLAESLLPGQEYELELRAVGPLLTAKLNGVIIGTAKDEAFPQGSFGVSVTDKNPTPTVVKSLEVLALSAPATVTTAPTAPTAEPWQELIPYPDRLSLRREAVLRGAAIHLPKGSGVFAEGSQRAVNAAIRAVSTYSSSTKAASLAAREGTGSRYAALVKDAKTVRLHRLTDGVQTIELGEFAVSPPIKEGADYELELRVVGQTVSVSCNGVRVGEVQDANVTSGMFGVWSFDPQPVVIKKLSYLPLDADPSSVAAEPWLDVLRDSAQLKLTDSVERTSEGIRFVKSGGVDITQELHGALRVRTRRTGGDVMLVARKTIGVGGYQFFVSEGKVAFLGWRDYATNITTSLVRVELNPPLAPDREYELELRAVGDELTAKLDGKVVAQARDERKSTGIFAIGTTASERGPIEIIGVDYLRLRPKKAVGTAESSSPAGAAREVPRVNSLGMKFVPVPITGGPTDGQRVLFSIWETRVQDYEVFATETKREWPKAGFQQGPDHPAVKVNWEDATAFCAWWDPLESTCRHASLSIL